MKKNTSNFLHVSAALLLSLGVFVNYGLAETKILNAKKQLRIGKMEKLYRPGDRGPAGGWVFYDKGNFSDGWRYLEAAPVDLGKAKWGCYGTAIPGARGTAVGTGKSNTQAIIGGCKEENTAAKKCAEYRGGGKSDWFLPSKEELILIQKNLFKKGIGGFDIYGYWSSSEQDKHTAWFKTLSDGFQNAINKLDRQQRVRPVRAF